MFGNTWGRKATRYVLASDLGCYNLSKYRNYLHCLASNKYIEPKLWNPPPGPAPVPRVKATGESGWYRRPVTQGRALALHGVAARSESRRPRSKAERCPWLHVQSCYLHPDRADRWVRASRGEWGEESTCSLFKAFVALRTLGAWRSSVT